MIASQWLSLHGGSGLVELMSEEPRRKEAGELFLIREDVCCSKKG
ncbi:hypothetical protein MIDIC_310005 [Alphaproteobacteria bacterium]